MEHDLIISGYGGQGVLFAGTLLAHAAIAEEKHTTWLPSYGAEMRGGTANCTVIVSDEEIASPYIEKSLYVIALNAPSVQKFENKIKSSGLMIINSSLIRERPERKDINCIFIPVGDIAQDLGESKCANIVALGALIAKTQVVSFENAINALHKLLYSKERLLKINCEALNTGAKYVNGLLNTV